jgi:hypothetical protein
VSKTPEDYKNLFSQINAKLESTDPEDIKTVASGEYKEVVELLLHEFQTLAPNKVHVRDPYDVMDKIIGEYPMTGRFIACDFDESAVRGAWQALGIAASMPGPRQLQWQEQTDDIVNHAPKPLLDLVTRAYSMGRTGERVSTVDIPVAKIRPADLATYPVPAAETPQVEIDIDEIIMKMKESPAVRQAILEIVQGMTNDLNAIKPRVKGGDEGPGL